MSVVGLDIGTNGCKAIVFDSDGRVLGKSSREYPIVTPQPRWAEQDAEHVYKLALETLGEAVSQSSEKPDALALSVQGEAVIPVDEIGTPLRPAILGMDTRTDEENEWLGERFGADTLFDRTGMPIHTINTLPKLLWLKKHERKMWERAERFLLYEDFFMRRLGGRAVISNCLASRTQMYDLSAGAWADDILAACDIDPGRLAPLAPAEGGAVGNIHPDLAEFLGLNREVLLVSGGHDQACAALGSGVTEEGLAMVSTGTAEVVETAMAKPMLDEKLRQGNISVYRHVVPGLFLSMTLNHSGGLLLRWFRDTLCRWESEQARGEGRDPYDEILADAPEGPSGLLVMPHFSGSGTPLFDTASKGAIIGLTFETTRPVLAKAILEGITFELRINIDLLREAGHTIRELLAVGGGARSPLWLQLKADICKLPLRVPKITEAACLGAAMLALVAREVYPDMATAVSRVVVSQQRVEPRADASSLYEEKYQLYRKVYPALVPIHHAM